MRSHNEHRAYDRIRELLKATGRFNKIPESLSPLNLLQIGACRLFQLEGGNLCGLMHLVVVYWLTEMNNGVVDDELVALIHKFFS